MNFKKLKYFKFFQKLHHDMVNTPWRKTGLGKWIIAHFPFADVHGECVFLDDDEQVRGIICRDFVFLTKHWGLQFAAILQILIFFKLIFIILYLRRFL